MIDKGVYKKSKTGFAWATLSNGIKGGLGFLTLFILTYFLGAEKMGLVSILTVIYGLSETLVRFGLSQSIISRSKTTRSELTSIFWANLFIGFFAFLIVNLLASTIAGFYDRPDLLIYIRILSFAFLIEPLDLIFRAILEKELEFPKLEKVNILKSVSLSLTTIVLVFFGFGVFGFVYGVLISIVISLSTLTFIFVRNKLWLPSFHFSLQEIKAHYSFGVFVTGKSFLNYIGRNFDELIVGKLLGLEALGFYYFAKKIVEKPMALVRSSISKIAFPLFAKLREDVVKLNKAYLTLSHVVAVVGVAFFGLMIIAVPYAIPVVFDGEWMDAIFLIQIFAVISLIDILASGLNTAVLYVFNEPRFVFKINLIFTPIRLVLIAVASLISIEAVALVFLLVVLSKTTVARIRVNSLLEQGFGKYLNKIKDPFFNGAVSMIVTLTVIYLLTGASDLVLLIVSSLIYCITFGSLLYIREREALKLFKKEILGK